MDLNLLQYFVLNMKHCTERKKGDLHQFKNIFLKLKV